MLRNSLFIVVHCRRRILCKNLYIRTEFYEDVMETWDITSSAGDLNPGHQFFGWKKKQQPKTCLFWLSKRALKMIVNRSRLRPLDYNINNPCEALQKGPRLPAPKLSEKSRRSAQINLGKPRHNNNSLEKMVAEVINYSTRSALILIFETSFAKMHVWGNILQRVIKKAPALFSVC